MGCHWRCFMLTLHVLLCVQMQLGHSGNGCKRAVWLHRCYYWVRAQARGKNHFHPLQSSAVGSPVKSLCFTVSYWKKVPQVCGTWWECREEPWSLPMRFLKKSSLCRGCPSLPAPCDFWGPCESYLLIWKHSGTFNSTSWLCCSETISNMSLGETSVAFFKISFEKTRSLLKAKASPVLMANPHWGSSKVLQRFAKSRGKLG